MTIKLSAGERLDDLHRKGYKIIQNEQSFRFGIDAVLLSGFAAVKPGEKAIDLGTGNGVIPILLAAKTAGCDFTGLEIQPESADMALRSVKYNHLEERVRIVQGDLKESRALFGAEAFEVVTCNPPYMIDHHGLKNTDLPKAIARHEICCTLDDVIRQASGLLKFKGRFYMVHRPFRLAEIILKLVEHKLEPKRMRLVHPFADKEPNMVLIEALKGGRSRMKVEKPLIVYREPGICTDEILEIYNH